MLKGGIVLTHSAVNHNNKKRKRSPLLGALIIIIMLLLVLLTLALFTSFDEVTHASEGGRVDIVLKEENWNPQNAKKIVPGKVLDKDPKIMNNDRTDVYVFLEVIVPYDNLDIESEAAADKGSKVTGDTSAVPLYKFVDANGTYDTTYTSTQKINTAGWMLMSDYPKQNTGNKTYTYLYAHVRQDAENTKLSPLMPGLTTSNPLFNQIKLVNFNETRFDENRDYIVRVKAYGIQANYLSDNNQTVDDPAQVWGLINNS